ncbi:unnamed protein product, partial [Prorocentrum cordatum]
MEGAPMHLSSRLRHGKPCADVATFCRLWRVASAREMSPTTPPPRPRHTLLGNRDSQRVPAWGASPNFATGARQHGAQQNGHYGHFRGYSVRDYNGSQRDNGLRDDCVNHGPLAPVFLLPRGRRAAAGATRTSRRTSPTGRRTP